MIRNLKALGLAAFALLAMGALFASGASAQTPGVFTAGETLESHDEGEIFGEQLKEFEKEEVVNAFTSSAGEVKCEIGEFHGAVTGTDSALTIEPTYKHCTAAGLPATVTMNGCDYKFNQPTALGSGTYTGTVDLVCPSETGVDIEIYLFGGNTSHSFKVCTLTVEPFKEKGHVVYTNKEIAEDDEVIVHATVEDIPFVEHNQACEAGEQEIPHTTGGNGPGVGATYESIVTVRGVEPITDVWISDEE